MKKIVFMGDSITDAERNMADAGDLGHGFVRNIHDIFCASYPVAHLEFLNKGISGNRLTDLRDRWERDCIQENPDIMSIMIGINDTWRAFDSGMVTSKEAFHDDYCRALDDLLENRADTRLILCEPFLLLYPDDRKLWLDDFHGKLEVVRELAAEYDALLVPFHKSLCDAARLRPPNYWAGDGVHPTDVGHMFLALEWMKFCEEILR